MAAQTRTAKMGVIKPYSPTALLSTIQEHMQIPTQHVTLVATQHVSLAVTQHIPSVATQHMPIVATQHMSLVTTQDIYIYIYKM